ncbi:MAG TPA: hypothetical protein VK158_06605 [Acidobacteriota bacterium]|nr:hypothetical protein [Acidobacteriota bacterium]
MKTVVLSVGGSLIFPTTVDSTFLSELVRMVQALVVQKYNIIIACGGGNSCRQYLTGMQETAKKLKMKLSTEATDTLGISLTHANAILVHQLIRSLGDLRIRLDPQINVDPRRANVKRYNVIIRCGYEPGHSTDYDAVLAAIAAKSGVVYNLTNIDYVYTKDPKKFSDAKPLKSLSWKEYHKMFSAKWTSGLHSPFDPIASRLCEAKNITVFCVNGKKLSRVQSLITSGKTFGTKMHHLSPQ